MERKRHSLRRLSAREDQQRCMSVHMYHDQPEGGCFLTTAQELGCNVFVICEQEEDE